MATSSAEPIATGSTVAKPYVVAGVYKEPAPTKFSKETELRGTDRFGAATYPQ